MDTGVEPSVEPGEVIVGESFDTAFWRLVDIAHRRAYRVLGVQAEAEDVAAETLARAAIRWPRLTQPADAWVTTVATRLAIDRQRRAWRSLPLDDDPDVTAMPDVAARIDLARALAALPRRQRQVLGLAFVSGFTEAEIAELLGCSPSTVQTHKRRGLARLRERLDVPEPTAPLDTTTPVRARRRHESEALLRPDSVAPDPMTTTKEVYP
ncbi:MAG TPA: RNA polymerase sigma factor [Acidimicrobiales bacterium]|nr:RNA polymerase sigma factor [Acidimicrobiales bacterium]